MQNEQNSDMIFNSETLSVEIDQPESQRGSIPNLSLSEAHNNSDEKQEVTGRWSQEEHRLFIKGWEFYGKRWKKIAAYIKTRSPLQVRTHAQKHFIKLSKLKNKTQEFGESDKLTQRKKSRKRTAKEISPPISENDTQLPITSPTKRKNLKLDIFEKLCSFAAMRSPLPVSGNTSVCSETSDTPTKQQHN
eukprot:gene8731-11797_t